MRAGILVVVVAGCSYKAGSFHSPRASFDGLRATVGCVDLAVTRKPQVADEAGGIVVQYAFGNRCDQPATIDLAAVHVVGRTAEGREVKLVPYDPDAELTPLPLDAYSAGTEAIAYRDPRGGEVVTACVDAASLAHAGAPRWVCAPPPTAADQPAGSDEDLGFAGDYVGTREHGTKFAPWAMPMRLPAMFIEWGLESRTVSLAATSLAAGTPAQLAAGRVTAPALTTAFRFGAGGHHIYMGVELEVGGVGGVAESGEPPGASVFGGGYWITGVRGALGPVSVSAEVALGGRAVQGSETAFGTVTSDGAGVVEARVRTELWANPWVTLGATVGSSMLDRDEHLAGGFIGIHTRAYSGDRAR